MFFSSPGPFIGGLFQDFRFESRLSEICKKPFLRYEISTFWNDFPRVRGGKITIIVSLSK